MKYIKLDRRGSSHLVIILFFVVVFAVAGVAALVGSHAARKKLDPQPGVPQPVVDNSGVPNDFPMANAAGTGIDFTAQQQRAHIELAKSVGQKARSEVGSGYQSKYQGPPGQWCAAFASYVSASQGSGMPHLLSASAIKQWGQSRGVWHTASKRYAPRVGDIAVYSTVHVGVVVAADGRGNMKAVDGNWGNRVSYHTSGRDYSGSIWSNYRNFYTSGRRISGFVSPVRY